MTTQTHNAIATTALGRFDSIQVPTPKPEENEVVFRVSYASMIAFDTYVTDLGYFVDDYPVILGYNASGTVTEVGSGVKDLAVGDRVVAFAFVSNRAKGMQQYTVQPRSTVAKVPDSIPLDAAATIPDNLITSFYTIFSELGFPIPESFPASSPPAEADSPILVYGGGSTAGQYAIQLLHAAGYKNVLVTASSKHHDYLKSLGATHTFDYSSTTLAEDIANVVGGNGKVKTVIDAICAEATFAAISKIVDPNGRVAVLLPLKEGSNVRGQEGTQMYLEIPKHKIPWPDSVKLVGVRTFLYQKNQFLKDNLMPKIVPSLLASGVIKPNRVLLLDQGSFKDRVAKGLDLLRNNKVSGEKVVVKVD